MSVERQRKREELRELGTAGAVASAEDRAACRPLAPDPNAARVPVRSQVSSAFTARMRMGFSLPIRHAAIRFTYALLALAMAWLGRPAAPLAAPPADPARSQATTAIRGPDVDLFGKWKLVCSSAPRAPRERARCRIAQTVRARPSGTRILTVRIYPGPPPTVLITTPSGIFLKPGLAIAVDKHRPTAYAFETCNAEGCHVGIILTNRLLAQFRAGRVAHVYFFDGAEKPVRVPISLDGFSKGLARLRAVATSRPRAKGGHSEESDR